MTEPVAKKGILYIATTERFVSEAKRSAKSAKAVMDDVPVALGTGIDAVDGPFDHIFNIQNPDHHFGDRISALRRSPFEQTIALDTDTYVHRSIEDVFEILDEFDLAATLSPVWRESLSDAIETDDSNPPAGFPMFNGGVIGYNTDIMDEISSEWYDEYMKDRDRGVTDQPALMRVVYHSNYSFAVLPRAYNVRVPFKGFTQQYVKIIHGRVKQPERIAEEIEQFNHPVIYDSAVAGDASRVIVNIGVWRRRLGALRLAWRLVGPLGTMLWMVRWAVSDDREGSKPETVRDTLRNNFDWL